jgi:predicted nucleic acid-binding protein
VSAPSYLIDTHVLACAIDGGDRVRAALARDWLAFLARFGTGTMSAQALTELATVALYRLEPAWTCDEVSVHLSDLSLAYDVLPVTAAIVLEAVRGVRDHRLSLDGAHVWAVAKLHQVPYLLTQEGPTGATVEGVTFVDPFRTAP